jgi:DNA-nicking Smr family endonuclease
MMWQKKLKILKKQLPATPKVAKETPKEPEIKPLSFGEYCQSLQITPLKTNIEIYQNIKPSTKPRINLEHTVSTISQEFEFFDEQDSLNEFFRHGQKNLPKELRSGKLTIRASLDLHSYSKAHALELLERFIDQQAPGTCIKIIHGQGTNSMYNQAILLGVVRKYLSHLPQVLAYSYGTPAQGGNGVTLVKIGN